MFMYQKSNWIQIYEKKKKKKEVSIIKMYIAPPISNLASSEQGNGINWKLFKVDDKGGAHFLCKVMQLYDF